MRRTLWIGIVIVVILASFASTSYAFSNESAKREQLQCSGRKNGEPLEQLSCNVHDYRGKKIGVWPVGMTINITSRTIYTVPNVGRCRMVQSVFGKRYYPVAQWTSQWR